MILKKRNWVSKMAWKMLITDTVKFQCYNGGKYDRDIYYIIVFYDFFYVFSIYKK